MGWGWADNSSKIYVFLMDRNFSDSALNCNRLEFWWLPNRNKTTGPLAIP